MVSFNRAPARYLPVSLPTQKGGRTASEKSFIRIGLLFGLLFLLITPPFQVADESRHFVRAYRLSEAVLSALGCIPEHDQLPKSLVLAIREMEPMRFDPTVKATLTQTLYLMAPKLKPAERASYGETANYPLVSYLPQLIVIIPFRLAQVNAVITLYAARFVALLFWLAATLWAIRKIPVARPLLIFIALLPMTIYQAGSLSADSVTLWLSFMLVAYYLHLAYKKTPVSARELWIAGSMGVLLTAAKLVYVPLIGLHFLIPPARFRSYATYLLSFGLTALICAAAIVLLYSDFMTNVMLPEPRQEVQLSAPAGPTSYPQLNFMLESPANWLRVLGVTGAKYGRYYIDSFVGSLGWIGATLPSYLTIVTIVMLWLTAFSTDSYLIIRPWHKILLAAIVVLVTLIICVALCTDTGLNPRPALLLLGIQGRYFIPVAMLIGMLVANRFAFRRRYGRYVQAAMWPFLIFLLLNAVYTLVNTYYVL